VRHLNKINWQLRHQLSSNKDLLMDSRNFHVLYIGQRVLLYLGGSNGCWWILACERMWVITLDWTKMRVIFIFIALFATTTEEWDKRQRTLKLLTMKILGFRGSVKFPNLIQCLPLRAPIPIQSSPISFMCLIIHPLF